MLIDHADDFRANVTLIRDLESAGLDMVWIPEAYGFDAVSRIGYLAAVTSTIQIGSGIINAFSRTAGCIAQTAAGLDDVSDGRFVLGLGASGPQVIEGFHGLPFVQPMTRIREYIAACRMAWRREPLMLDGRVVTVPLPATAGTGLGKALKLINRPVRERIPIFWASLMGKSVEATAELADGWLPAFFDPERFDTVWGPDLRRGLAARDPSLGPLQIATGGLVGIGDRLVGDAATRILDRLRPSMALYLGGMGARGANFYNTICQRYGYVEAARQVQESYLSGDKARAAALVPSELLRDTNLVGPPTYIRERIEAYRAAGVTQLWVTPTEGDNPVGTIDRLRRLI